MRNFIKKYPHFWTLGYMLIYLPWFVWLESRANQPYHVIHFVLDDYIPFEEVFIVPYFLWFLYVAAVVGYLFFHDVKNYYRTGVFLVFGMTLFLVISTVYPNGHLLRPTTFEKNNLFILLVRFLYFADTATDIFPSIHVYNSIAAHMAIVHCPKLKENPWIHYGSLVLMILIILSTMFLKQHSTIDVAGGIALGIFMNYMVYHCGIWKRLNRKNRVRRSGQGGIR